MILPESLRSAAGTYIVWLYLPGARRLHIGSLGVIAFEPGHYAYVGSAFGPGGIRARLGRHFRRYKKTRWHIDYLRTVSEIKGAWVSYGRQRLEHHWAGVLQALPGARLPVARFGASDCRCETHLTRFSKPPSLKVFLEEADAESPSVVQVT